MKKLLLLAVVFAGSCAHPPKPSPPPPVWLVDLRGRSLEEKAAVFTAQGIANRAGPRVFVRLGAENAWMSLANPAPPKLPGWAESDLQGMKASGVESTEDAWMQWLTENRGLRFAPLTPEGLLAALGDEIKGVALYDNLGEDLAPVATFCGLNDAIPLTPALQARWARLIPERPVLLDYRKIRAGYAPGADRRIAAHQWLVDHLLARCATDGAVARARLYGQDAHDTITDIDQAAQNRWVVYDLNHSALTNHAHGVSLKTDPPDARLIDTLMGHLLPLSLVYGWGVPGEDSFIRSLNRNGMLGTCSGVPNNSFFAALDCSGTTRTFHQKRPHARPESVVVEDKIYIAFMVNEGDSIKTLNAFQGMGGWLQPERGRIPINWGIAPNLCQSHPALMSYYFETATPNDYFFAPPSGWGYAHPGFLPPHLLMPYAEKIRAGMLHADLRFIDIWWLGELRLRGQLEPFLRAAGVEGLTDWDGGRQAVLFDMPGIPVIKSNHYYTFDKPAPEFAERIIRETRDLPAPWFITVYGAKPHATPHRFVELSKHLPPDRFKIVPLDEFFAAASSSRARVEGREVIPSK